jgi:hypothetical protein
MSLVELEEPAADVRQLPAGPPSHHSDHRLRAGPGRRSGGQSGDGVRRADRGPRARFGITFSRLGLHPGGGCTYFLVQALGAQRALALLLDGATLTAEEKESSGLVLRVVDDPLPTR